jgi:hypothetical protein
MISERDAKTNNLQTIFTNLFYTLVVEDDKQGNLSKEERSVLFHKVRKELGITVPNNTSNEQLLRLIEEHNLDLMINNVKN